MKPKTTTTKEKIAGINEVKHTFFEKANNINKCLARLSKEEEWTQTTNVRNRRRTISKDPTGFIRIRKYYEQFYAHTFENLSEIDQFPLRHNLTKLKKK